MKLTELERMPSFGLLGPGFGGSWLLVTELAYAPKDPTLVLAPFEAAPGSWLLLRGKAEPVEIEIDAPAARTEVTLDTSGYLERVREIRAAIAAGDVYQVCLTLRAHVSACAGSALAAAMWSPEPPSFAAWVRLPDGTELVSASPELLLAVEGRRARTEPMKGTAPAGGGHTLSSSEKDAAELAMITDLLRNDLTPVCVPGSIRVADRRRFVPLPYAIQTVSVVEGELLPDRTALDALSALHPGGSVTGAPKAAALRMLRALETGPRGIYCGALGLRQGERATFSLLIRTAARATDGWVYGVGSGVVYDSEPERELEELHLKLGALGGEPVSGPDPAPASGPGRGSPAPTIFHRTTVSRRQSGRGEYTLLRKTERGVVLLEYHLQRLGADLPGREREAVRSFLASARAGVWAVRREGGHLRGEPRRGSRLTDGMPARCLPSPLAAEERLRPKPPSPGPYDSVRAVGVATLLTSPDGSEIWEACSAAVLGWDGTRLVIPPGDRPRVWSTAETAVREHLEAVEAPIPVVSALPLLLVNAVKGTCQPRLPGREPFPPEVRARIERLFAFLTDH